MIRKKWAPVFRKDHAQTINQKSNETPRANVCLAPHNWEREQTLRGRPSLQRRSFRLLTSGIMIVAWQGNDELREFAEPGFDVDSSAMLLDDDVMGHREAEPRSLSGWLGGEKGIEHLLFHLGRDTAAVVANPDF